MRAAILFGIVVLSVVASACPHDDPAAPDAAMRDAAVASGSGGVPATMMKDAATAPDVDAATKHPDAGGHDGSGGAAPSKPCAVDATDKSLPGVSVHVEGDRCSVETDQHHLFRYRIEVEDDIPYTSPDSAGACGRCGGDASSAKTLVDIAIGDGQAITYCQCDVGCCPPTTAQAVTLKAATVEAEIDWPGRQWHGPSDTNQPLGDPFPPGDYFVTVTFEVPGKGKVVAKLPIQVTAASGVGSPGKTACKVGGKTYPSGATGVPDPSSCNTCTCDDGEITGCTEIACPKACPAGTTLGTSCAECGPTDACLVVEHGCLPMCAPGGDECAASGGFCTNGTCRKLCG